MKKRFLLLLVALGLSSVGSGSRAVAQELKRNIFGVDVGMNVSSLSISGTFLNVAPSSKMGFSGGLSYQRLVVPSQPIYIETGIHYSQKGAIYRESDLDLELRTSHIEVPLLVNYHYDLGSDFSVIPSLGLYCSYGIAGDYILSGTSGDSGLDGELAVLGGYVVYGDRGELKRANMGMRFGVSFGWKMVAVRAIYERDLLNGSKIDEGVNDNSKTRNNVFRLSVGYRF